MAECRGLFGVAMLQDVDGNMKGHKMSPLNYTGQKVIGPVRFEKEFWKEVNRVNNLKTTGTTQSKYWKLRGEGLQGGAYQAKFGRRWKKKVIEQLGKGGNAVRNVTDLMDHCIAEGKRIFKNTRYARSFVIYHDALSAWWSEAAQAHMRRKGFANRQVRGLGFTNHDTRY